MNSDIYKELVIHSHSSEESIKSVLTYKKDSIYSVI